MQGADRPRGSPVPGNVMTDQKIRVLVVDDHPFFRTGIVQWLNQQSDLKCIGEAGNIAQARKAIDELKPDVVLLDLHLPDGDGLDLCSELCQERPGTRILCLTHRDENTFAHRALRNGARGYVMKSEATETVHAGIRAVMKGDTFVSRQVAARGLHNWFRSGLATPIGKLRIGTQVSTIGGVRNRSVEREIAQTAEYGNLRN